jgi:hypothetical protein
MQMKQTAVEMIFESFFDMKWEDMQDWQKPVIFLQAKEMEKEQMVDFVIKWMGEDDLKDDIIKHYNETYNKQ